MGEAWGAKEISRGSLQRSWLARAGRRWACHNEMEDWDGVSDLIPNSDGLVCRQEVGKRPAA